MQLFAYSFDDIQRIKLLPSSYFEAKKFEFIPEELTSINIQSDFSTFNVMVMVKSSDKELDFEMAKYLFSKLGKLSHTDASDKGLWVYLACNDFMEFMKKRWPIPIDCEEDEKLKHIHQHWLYSQGLTRQHLLCLYWGARILYNPNP